MSNYITHFSNKIKLLRTTYNLSQGELSKLISLKNQSSLFAWENNTSSPLFENMISLSRLFCISLDWLAGSSQTIYTIDSVNAAEQVLFEQIDDDFIAGQEVGEIYRGAYLNELEQLSGALMRGIPKHIYSDVTLRPKYYSLAVRANIVVLLHLVPLGDLYWAEAYAANDGNKRGVLTGVKSRLQAVQLPQLAEYKEPGKKAKERAINLVKLFRPIIPQFSAATMNTPLETKAIQKTDPVYDVEAAYADLCADGQKG